MNQSSEAIRSSTQPLANATGGELTTHTSNSGGDGVNRKSVRVGFESAQHRTGEDTVQNVRFEPIGRATRKSKFLDRGLLEMSEELLEDIESAEADDAMMKMESLRYATCQLWSSATSASLQHQSLLALIESFVAERNSLDYTQAASLRGAIKDLSLHRLTEQHLEIIRSGLIDAGHNPLIAFSDVENDSQTGMENDIAGT